MRRLRRVLSTASAREPLLPRWGSWGKTSAQIAELEARVREDGVRQAAVSRHLAEWGLKVSAMVTRPVQWFGDPEWRAGWLETAAEPLERYSRINDRLLDGCEVAYRVIASEFHAEQPNFEQFVQSGALEPELAAFLEEALAKYSEAGRRPVLEQQRVNGQVLLCDATASYPAGFLATVVFRSREARSTARVGEPGSEAASADGAQGGVDAAAAGGPAATAGGSGSADDGEVAFEDVVQLWTFTAEHPNVGAYIQWLRSNYQMEAGVDDEGGADPPVRWTLRDINFTIHEYESPEMPEDPSQAVEEIVQRGILLLAMSLVISYSLFRVATSSRERGARPWPPPSPALGRQAPHAPEQHTSMQHGESEPLEPPPTRPQHEAQQPQLPSSALPGQTGALSKRPNGWPPSAQKTNRYGDPVNEHQQEQ